MAGVDDDIAEGLAAAWQAAGGGAVSAEVFVPFCELLCDAGLALGDESLLGARRLGPFRIANTPYRGAVEDFLKTLIPATMVGAAAGTPIGGALTGMLTGACRCFIELLRRGVVLRDTPDDRMRWEVLMYVRGQNARGVYPSLEDITVTLGGDSETDRAAVVDALAWLCSAHPLPEKGASSPLVVARLGGGLECLA